MPRWPPPSNPVLHTPCRTIQKTILLAKVSLPDMNKPSSSRANRLTHTVIISVNVKLDHSLGECNVNTVADIIKKQVGFDVILLDSKLYPLIANESTAGIDFWKSNRKIIATSRSVLRTR